MSNYWKNNSFQAQQETSRQSVPNVTLEETNRERNIFRTCFSTAGISETLFQLFVQGRQLVLHLPDFVLREGLLPTRIYEYLVTSFACQFSKDYLHSCSRQLKRIWLGCLTHNDHLQHFVAGSLAVQLYSGNECLPGRREALPKASLLHVEPLVHYLTNLLPSMSIIAIEELVRMRYMRYIQWSLSLLLAP